MFIAGCTQENTPKRSYDAKALLQQKCAICHNLKMPPDTFEDEKAPPMMAVVFHLKDFMHITMPEEKEGKFIPFIQSYVIEPSAKRAYCDKKSLESYGVMPSQKGNVTQEELYAIGEYLFDFYDQEKFLKQMQAKAAFDALPKGEQLVVKMGCYNCHALYQDKTAPSFAHIAQKRSQAQMIASINKGSQGAWEGFHLMMPPYEGKFTPEELKTLTAWIASYATKEAPKVWKVK